MGKDASTGEELLDLQNETVGLLGDYLSYIVQNAENVFGISPGNEQAASSNRGDSLVLPEEQGAEDVFVKQGTILSSKLSENSNSGYFGAAGENLVNIIDKTGLQSNSHKLLSGISGADMSSFGETLTGQEGDESKPTVAVGSVLARNNRFANIVDKNAYAVKGEPTSDFEAGVQDLGTHTSQRSFGKFDLEGSKITLDQLKQVGASLLYKASGYDQGDQPRSSADPLDLHGLIDSEQVTSVNFEQDTFNKVDFRNLRAKYAKGAPDDESGNSTRDNRGDILTNQQPGRSSNSFGTNFNTSVNFSGKGRRILRLKAAIACIALKKVTKDFMDQIGDFIRFSDLKSIQETSDEYVTPDKTYSGPGPFPLGSYKQLNSFELDMFKKVVLVRTDYPYPACFEKGIEVFFGSDEDVSIVKDSEHIKQAPGYWLSVASSVLKTFDQLSLDMQEAEAFTSDSVDTLANLLEIVKSNKLISFANAAATVGDVFFKTNHGAMTKTQSARQPYNVDSMASGPGSRVSKSRDSGAESPLNLSWRQGATPSMYLLPRNVVKASVDLNTIFDGASPTRGMLTSVLVKNTYMDRTHGGSFNRIPNDVVKRLEDQLEAEYVPFYIQDLRTNEVVSFHAFLSSLTDNIKANYTGVDGYGRMDPVQIYKSTNRSIGVKFTLFATSKEDFDSMWYKINKLTTLLYPQWTQGTQLSATGVDRFIQPFSQVVGASPIVRLRIGDVIKSNYSRFNLSRMFGIGDENINPILGDDKKAFEALKKRATASLTEGKITFSEILTEVFYALIGTPLQYIPSSGNSRISNLGLTLGRNVLSRFLINGFVNPLGAGFVLKKLTDPNTNTVASAPANNLSSFGETLATKFIDNPSELGYSSGDRVLVKANTIRGYSVEDGTIVRFSRPLKGIVMKTVTEDVVGSSKNLYINNENFKSGQTYDGDRSINRSSYMIQIVDHAGPGDIFGQTIKVDHQEVIPDPGDLFMNFAGIALGLANPVSFLDYLVSFIDDAILSAGVGSEATQIIKDLYATQPEQFMQPENNPFTRALESTMGRGLAGVIDGFNFDWCTSDFTWETDYNSRAPKGVEISFNLQVIHDLPPGIDHSGYNRAPLYNVGEIMKNVTGDARGDDSAAEFEYRRAGNATFSKTGK